LASVAAIAKGDSAYIRGMAVLPPARGLGMGVKLLAVVEQWAVEEGCSRIFLSTTPFLHASIRLYEKQGFRRTPEGPQNLFGTPLFTMEKKIPRKRNDADAVLRKFSATKSALNPYLPVGRTEMTFSARRRPTKCHDFT